MISLKNCLRRFRRDQDGSIAVEFMFTVPILIWILIAPLQYFDAYRSEAKSNKAALALADMFSRETGYITHNYLNGANRLLKNLTLTETNPSYRVTVFTWNQNTKKYVVRWSRRRGEDLSAPLTTSELRQVAHRLPVLAHQERAILLETKTDYIPKYGNGFGIMEGTGLNSLTMSTFLVTEPRFAPTLCWKLEAAPVADEIC